MSQWYKREPVNKYDIAHRIAYDVLLTCGNAECWQPVTVREANESELDDVLYVDDGYRFEDVVTAKYEPQPPYAVYLSPQYGSSPQIVYSQGYLDTDDDSVVELVRLVNRDTSVKLCAGVVDWDKKNLRELETRLLPFGVVLEQADSVVFATHSPAKAKRELAARTQVASRSTNKNKPRTAPLAMWEVNSLSASVRQLLPRTITSGIYRHGGSRDSCHTASVEANATVSLFLMLYGWKQLWRVPAVAKLALGEWKTRAVATRGKWYDLLFVELLDTMCTEKVPTKKYRASGVYLRSNIEGVASGAWISPSKKRRLAEQARDAAAIAAEEALSGGLENVGGAGSGVAGTVEAQALSAIGVVGAATSIGDTAGRQEDAAMHVPA